MTAIPANRESKLRPVNVLVIATCWATLLAEGYDIVSYGTVVPALLQYGAWSLTPAQAGAIGSYAIIGMLFGALIVGTIGDLIGRRRALVLSISVFSVGMCLCAVAPSPEALGLFRFVAGLGLGGGMPTAIAFTSEYAPPKWRAFSVTFIMSGFAVGAVLAALLAIPLIPAFGWQVMFWIGIIPLFVIVPLALWVVPESVNFLVSRGRREEAEAIARRYRVPITPEAVGGAQQDGAGAGRLGSLATMFSGDYIRATLCFWAATFMALFVIFGLQTWLPELMRGSGYSLGSALSFLLVLNLATVFGTVFAGALADLWSSKMVTVISFVLAAVCIGLLSIPLPLAATYVLVALAGIGGLGSQNLLNAYVSKYYPAHGRSTALGWTLGIGRLGGISAPFVLGLLLSSQLGLRWSFYAIALAAVLGAVFVALLPGATRDPAGPEVPERAAAEPREASPETVRGS